MPQTIRTAGFALALLLLSLAAFAPAIAEAPPNKYGYCSGLAGRPTVNNYTRIFVLGPSSPPGALSGFFQVLHKKYDGLVSQEKGCRMFATAAEAESEYRQTLNAFEQNSAKWPMVEIDWIPEGGSTLSGAAPAAEAAPAAPAPATKPAVTPEPAPAVAKPAVPAPAKPAVVTGKPAVYVLCRSEWNRDLRRFYNPPVDGRGAGYAEWQASYHAYLVSQHAFKGSNHGCGKYLTKEAAQADYDALVAKARATPSINGQPSPIIITDWNY